MPPTRPVDVQTHFLPPAIIDALEARDQPPHIVDGPKGVRLVQYGPGAAYPLTESMTDIDRKIADMDEGGVGTSVLSINIPGLDMFDPADVGPIARDVNDQLAELAASNPDRLAAFAALPMLTPDAVPGELERALKVGHCGAMIYSNVNGRALDEPEYRQLFDAAERLDGAILLHPTYPLSAAGLQKGALVPTIGFLFDTTTATMRLILDGLFDRNPDLKLILGHVGSVIPYILARIDYELGRIPGGLAEIDAPPSEHVRKLHVDTVSGGSAGLTLGIDLFGADRVLYATDHPFWDPKWTNDALAAVELSDVDREAIEIGNAVRLLKLDG